jgi:hypothetical protein
MFQGKRKKPQYTGDIIVCFCKARPFSNVENGREIIGALSNTKIKTTNTRFKHSSDTRLYSENELAVPVAIFNLNCPKVIDNDWTREMSPITEIGCKPVERWWPRSIFRGSQKIGDITEEVIIEYPKYILKLQVSYAFTGVAKELFSDIWGNERDEAAKKKDELRYSVYGNGGDENGNDFKEVRLEVVSDYLPTSSQSTAAQKEEEKSLQVVPEVKAKGKAWKYVVGGLATVALVTGIIFGVKYFVANKSQQGE